MRIEIICYRCDEIMPVEITEDQPNVVVDRLYEHMMLIHQDVRRIPRESIELLVD